LKALIRLGYEIAYITDINSKGNQKDIIEILEGGKHTVNYIDKKMCL
jgi:nitrogen regulatory protein PII